MENKNHCKAVSQAYLKLQKIHYNFSLIQPVTCIPERKSSNTI